MCFADIQETVRPERSELMSGTTVGPCVVQGCKGTVMRHDVPGRTVQACSEPGCRSPFVQASAETVRTCAKEVDYDLAARRFAHAS